MIAVVPVRDGVLPAGALEAIAECGGATVLVGSGLDDVANAIDATQVTTIELGDVEIGRWTGELAAALPSIPGADAIVLPNSPDGRDLAPRLAHALDVPLFAGAMQVARHNVQVVRSGGREVHRHLPDGPFVATLQPGVRGVEGTGSEPTVHQLEPASIGHTTDARVIEVLPPDVTTMDLAEARRIVGGGAGLDTEERFTDLDTLAGAVGASMGATRVITDRDWVHHDKQIGTTGVVVDPELYISFGVSGAVQHTAGLGTPDHVISVNTDPHCPMMQMSDLAVVSDANETLDALLDQLGAR